MKTHGTQVVKSKVVGNFHVHILRIFENKKSFLELLLLLFNQNVTYCLVEIKTDTVILSSDAETVKFENSSFTLIYTFFHIFPRKGWHKVVLHAKE